MILVDTSVWVDYLRKGEGQLRELLSKAQVLTHPYVVGELACGSLQNRDELLGLLDRLPCVICASDTEVRMLIEKHGLMGRGIGFIDAHLLASVRLTQGAQLWSHDKRLDVLAGELAVSH